MIRFETAVTLMRKFNLIDIGSAGLLSEPWAQHPEAVGHVLKFEPRDEDAKVEGVTFLPHALWSQSEERDFYVYRGFDGTGSSLYRQNYAYVAANFPDLKQRGDPAWARSWFERSGETRRMKMRCVTLDSALAELRASGHSHRYQFMKVDAQGADFDILCGAREYLRRDCLGVQCELFTVPLYEGIVLLDEVVAWLAGEGFDLWQKHPAHGTFHSQHDCVFIKRDADTSDLKQALALPVRRRGLASRVISRLRRSLS
jgi:FkbM family methyltransferase